MNREDFENLLYDLYKHYNPSKTKDIPMLLSKYNGRESDAVKTVFIMYNSPYNKEKYNSDFGTDNHVQFLINSYSAQKKVFSEEYLNKKTKKEEEVKVEKQKKEEEKKKEKLEKIGDELKGEIQEAVALKAEQYFKEKKSEIDNKLNNLFTEKNAEIEKFFKNKKEEIKKNIDAVPEIVKKILSNEKLAIKKEPEEDTVEIKLTFLNFEGKDIDLPGKDVMKKMGIGERMIVSDSEGKICGIAIKDIAHDNVSYKDKCIKDISIERL